MAPKHRVVQDERSLRKSRRVQETRLCRRAAHLNRYGLLS